MNQEKLQALLTEYRKNLTEAVKANPGSFTYNVDGIPAVMEKVESWMRLGVRTVMYTSPAWKATLKTLGIKPTHKAIAEFLETKL